MAESRTQPIAMLIDSDNAQPSLSENALAETPKYGVVTASRQESALMRASASPLRHAGT